MPLTHQAAYCSSGALVAQSDITVLRKIKMITSKGNDAEVRRKKDGSLAVYEVRKSAV